LGGRGLGADGVADEVSLGIGDLAVLGHGDGQRGAVVVVGEGDFLARSSVSIIEATTASYLRPSGPG
jgi:hypothetical protein